jgi:3',5'-cyclic AMP phosphodiesterase CpdA
MRIFRTNAFAGILFCLVLASVWLPGKTSSGRETPRYAGFADIDPAKNRVCLVGDTQRTTLWEFWRERNNQERKLVLGAILDRDPAFVINLGDLTAYGSSAAHWREFDLNHRLFRERRIPYLPILGNHEFYGQNQKALANFFNRFPYLEGRHFYSFAWNRIAFILLDSKFGKMNGRERKVQSDWYLNELERFERDENIDFIIACCHEAPFTNNTVIKANLVAQTEFAEPFARFSKAALFFSGHSHAYEKFMVRKKLFIDSGGGGGPRHKLDIDPKTRRYDDLYPGGKIRFFNFCEIERTEAGLLVKVHRLKSDGTFDIADQFTVAKRTIN